MSVRNILFRSINFIETVLVVLEVEQRKTFLNQMTLLGKRKEYQEVILNQISDVRRIRIS